MELKLEPEEEVDIYDRLLIVPYGIETSLAVLDLAHAPTFNRTLWN